jgi:hypothetical protein
MSDNLGNAEKRSKFIGVFVTNHQFELLTKLQTEIANREGATKPVPVSELVRRAILSYAENEFAA